ncbi:MAG: hypothetical protein JXA96_03560 [Sedimentisphaerales bacterium]|nr:hypothetical protein [Sedimentisphaerales bacterium]
MPAHRRKQSNVMLYTLIIFVGLFIVATTVAVFYYVKAEEHRITCEELQSDFDDFISEEEKTNIGSIVGETSNLSTSYMQTMVEYHDETVTCVVGGVAEATSAEVKTNNAKAKTQEALTTAGKYLDNIDPNLTGLAQVVNALAEKLQNTMESKAQTQQELKDKLDLFKKMEAANLDAYQTLLKEKDILRQDYNDVQEAYAKLSQEKEKSTDERVQYFTDQLDREKANIKKTMDDLLETQAILTETQTMLAEAKEELARFGTPKEDSMAYMPDGKILSIDNNTKTVIINLGSKNHVYRGLTFSVYDKGGYIGQEGQDKAEIEIFDIGDSYASARIVKSEINKPILKNDTIANLIWDSSKINEFVIAGDFDLDKDGEINPDAISKIKATIEKWGGKVTDKISVETDFLILGTMPNIPEQQPSIEEQMMDPTALQRYEDSLENLNRYNELETRARSLWVPIFTYEKFIHLIGYSEKSGQAGAF